MKNLKLKSKDGLPINADYYPVEKAKGFILLCHRSHFHRGEYAEIAPELNLLGYTCLAIDQRSGMNVLGRNNETKMAAKEKGLPTGYLDAKQDIEAAIDFCYKKNGNKKILLMGSSYSGSLALVLATTSDKLKAVMAYSPSECLKKISVAESISTLEIPTYVSSSMKENKETSEIIRHVNTKNLVHFKSKKEGFHGARTLWRSVKGQEEYWSSLKVFLEGV